MQRNRHNAGQSREATAMLPTEEQKRSYARDGGVRAPGFLTPDQMVRARGCFDWGMANPGPLAVTVYRGTAHAHYVAQMGHPPDSRDAQMGHPPELPGGSRASHAAREGVGSTRGQTGARAALARGWDARDGDASSRGRGSRARSGEAAQAVARTQCASVVVGARWRFEATRASHDVGSCRRPGGARPFPTGASCRLPAAHSTWAR